MYMHMHAHACSGAVLLLLQVSMGGVVMLVDGSSGASPEEIIEPIKGKLYTVSIVHS